MSERKNLEKLKRILQGYGKVAVAFSGGVDSTFLLHAAVDCLGKEQVLAITATADNFPNWETSEAEEQARRLGCRRLPLPFDPFAIPEFAANGKERCYHCKRALFELLIQAARQNGMETVADGTNADDMGDYRPGMRAVRELNVASPLLAAGLGKAAIRSAAKEMGLDVWDKPSFACLASRFPYGETITTEKLRRVEQAEQFFLDLGFTNIRVRHHGDLARVEVDAGERSKFFDAGLLDRARDELRHLGFLYATLDMGGYQSGSMNEGLEDVRLKGCGR